MDIDQILLDILAKRVDVSNLTDECVLTELGLDSLDLVEIMLEIEEALGVEFENEEILALRTVGDVKKLSQKKIAK